ncbi:CsxC family protein [Proteiniborus sp.]|uniref:CsxC family protein n=1 Tax=Proteiniborus sp. TaxID=2079015 RepID=UPI0033305849
MVNVKAEYPEGHKLIYETPNVVHTTSQESKELGNKELEEVNWQEEKVIENCPNEKVEITALTSGAVVKIPVVLAAFTVRINISSSIEFDESIFQIKEIIKRIKIQQCTLIQDTDVLFIKGVIRKNIKYYVNNFLRNNETYGDVETLVVDIPFKCTTIFEYNITKPEKAINSTLKEFKCIRKSDYLNNDTIENEEIVYEDVNYIDQIVTEYYNEAPYCEAIGSKIVEAERFVENRVSTDNESIRKGIYAIEGEGILYITIRILQNQIVSIPMTP